MLYIVKLHSLLNCKQLYRDAVYRSGYHPKFKTQLFTVFRDTMERTFERLDEHREQRRPTGRRIVKTGYKGQWR